VLGTPPAFVLSQDQTLHVIWKDDLLIFADFIKSLLGFLTNPQHQALWCVSLFSFQGSFSSLIGELLIVCFVVAMLRRCLILYHVHECFSNFINSG
jgi:hypothetical protein